MRCPDRPSTHVAGHSTLRDRYAALFRDRVYLGAAILGGMTFTGLFAYLSASSFLFQQVYDFTAQEYGLLFAVNSIGVITATLSSVVVSNKLKNVPEQGISSFDPYAYFGVYEMDAFWMDDAGAN